VLPGERIQPDSVYGSANGFGSRRIIAENRTRAAAEMDKTFLFYFAIFLKSGSDFHLGNRGLSPIVSPNCFMTFMIAGTGGPNVYKGKDMLVTHKGMNISATEFMAVLDDFLAAFAKNKVAQREQEEALYVLYNMRSQIVLV
jgi:hemoglobin